MKRTQFLGNILAISAISNFRVFAKDKMQDLMKGFKTLKGEG